MDILDRTEALVDDFKRYLSTRIELFKLETLDTSSEIGAGVVSRIIVSIAAIFALLFLSVWAALYLSMTLGVPYIGFGIVGGFYTLIFLILLIGRKSVLEKPIRNGIISNAESGEKEEIHSDKDLYQTQNTET